MKKNGYVKSITTGLVIGGLAFAATKAMNPAKNTQIKRAAGKALKAVGSVIETLQM